MPKPMVMATGRADVALVRGTTARPLLDVITIRAVRGHPATRICAGAVPDLGAPPHRLPRDAGATLVVLGRALADPISAGGAVAVAKLANGPSLPLVGLPGQIGDHVSPAAEALRLGGQV